jgi:hypothetical protein
MINMNGRSGMRPGGQSYLLVLLGACVAAATARAELNADFSRYEAIISRKPFGEPPPPTAAAVPAQPAQPAQPPFVNNLRLVAITESKFGTKVGFLDISQNPPKSYYLPIGGSSDGIEVLDADYDLEAALLRKGGEEQWLYLKGGAAGAPTGGAPSGAPGVVGLGPGVPGMGVSGAATDPSGGRAGYYERRQKRRDEILEERRKASLEREKIGSEELRKQLREYNLELIRARGEKGPPLPIPLTVEEDTKLVQEGVLPPR